MNCPICSVEIVRLPYEGVPLYHCQSCHGHLLYRDQIDAFKRRRDQTEQQLEAEAAEVATHHGELRCPKCRGPMKTELSNRHSHVYWDHCRECDLVWLDAGELAKIQLERESMLQAHEYETMREHWKHKPKHEISDFQRKLAERMTLLAEAEAAKKPVGVLAKTMNFLFRSNV